MRVATRVAFWVKPSSLKVFGLTAGLFLVFSTAHAHELGTIRTYATFRKSGEYEIRVFIDREHLPPGFASSAGPPLTRIEGLRWDPADRAARILSEVLNHSRIAFDGREVWPRAAWEGGSGTSCPGDCWRCRAGCRWRRGCGSC